MDADEIDEVPMLRDTERKPQRRLSHRNRSVTISILPSSSELSPPSSQRRVCFTGPLFGGRKKQRQGNPSETSHGAIGVERKYHAEQGDSKNEHLLRSGQLGMCNDPYCTTCPSSFNYKEQLKKSNGSSEITRKHHVKGWARKKLALLKQFAFGVMNPHAKVVQQWNQFIVISCLLAIFIDPLFFYLLSTNKDHKCIIISWSMMLTLVAFRSITDLIYLMHMLVQFRLAFISPESRVVGTGVLVDHPKKIALHYLSGFFFFDLFIVLPLPQIIVTASSGANHANNLLRSFVLVQYVPRLYRFLPLLAGQTPSGFIFDSAWANFIINLLTFVLSGHVVGSCWYLLGLQRVNQCLRDACRNSGIKDCMKVLDCGHGTFGKYATDPTWNSWKQNENSSACFNEDDFPYGIYGKVVNLTTKNSIITRYVYSFFWGFQVLIFLGVSGTNFFMSTLSSFFFIRPFMLSYLYSLALSCVNNEATIGWSRQCRTRDIMRNNRARSVCFTYMEGNNRATSNPFVSADDCEKQISTLAGNQTPSYFEWEVLFTMGIIGLGLLLFALLIGNMQNFLQGLGRRRLERSLRRRDVEQWMSHRHLPEDLRIKVRDSERYNWAATRGVNEERLMENLPEDLQRDIRRHLLKFVKKVRILALMDESILDAICERLRQKTYIEGCQTLYQGGFVTKMVFIVRGKMESVGEDGNIVELSEGDVCGEELLRWCLEDSSVIGGKRNHIKPRYILSKRTVECLTNVEAFVLQAEDLEEVTSLFAGFLRNHRVQNAIRNESPYWRGLAAWRYRKKRGSREVTSRGGATRHS